MNSALTAACAVLLLAAVWELIGSKAEAGVRASRRWAGGGAPGPGFDGPRSSNGSNVTRVTRATRGTRGRLVRSGRADRISYRQVIIAKAAAAAIATVPGGVVADAFPPRMQMLIAIAIPLVGFWLPDLLLARAARSRRAAMMAELPAALDLMATGAASGRGVNALLGDAMRHTKGPLREELARVVTAIECGTAQGEALGALGVRGEGTRLGAVAATLERSRRHGSPLAGALHEQAGSLREDQRRELGEAAARAAPKMQLAVALVLVPSVLLIVAAAIVANAGSLLPGF